MYESNELCVFDFTYMRLVQRLGLILYDIYNVSFDMSKLKDKVNIDDGWQSNSTNIPIL